MKNAVRAKVPPVIAVVYAAAALRLSMKEHSPDPSSSPSYLSCLQSSYNLGTRTKSQILGTAEKFCILSFSKHFSEKRKLTCSLETAWHRCRALGATGGTKAMLWFLECTSLSCGSLPQWDRGSNPNHQWGSALSQHTVHSLAPLSLCSGSQAPVRPRADWGRGGGGGSYEQGEEDVWL